MEGVSRELSQECQEHRGTQPGNESQNQAVSPAFGHEEVWIHGESAQGKR